ncbi:T9SS type A sorting domain-containing protein [Mangrovimonas spongiae]|uniref:T9SS C-terminal target domain-containing protein n=1 Tax=Mangrovimonas spongiae TaxID=2494697 RepID=A0A3R9M7W5_9FLAO|nr:T9SS type A sorting domain-containing protein [Mangrovimonas spongiae]RSK39311.1 T9SS C-terminal target domain-containing protein [Mangrovimonas spongiae]
MKKLLPFILTLMLCQIGFSQTTYYVDVSRPDNTGNGLSWATAKKDLQNALDLTVDGDEVRVASGTYHPNSAPGTTLTNPTEFYFWMNTNINLKGSYDPSTDTQDFSNPSILSGDLGTTNTVHVLVTTNLNNTALVEGFNITGGAAVHNSGSVTIGGHTLQYREGGGMYNASSSPNLVNVTFYNNSALYYGGGIYNASSSPNLVNVAFYNNSSSSWGGGMFNASSSPNLVNVTFVNNSANYGGGMYNNNSSNASLFNTVLYANGDDIYNVSGFSFSANNFSENFTGTGFTQLTTNPFVDSSDPIGADGIWNTADDGLYPANGSVLINAGDNSFNTEATDITGNPRVLFNTIDAGAYEVFNLQPDANNILYVNKNASGGDGSGNSWANAVTELAEASLWANSIQDMAWQTTPLQIWVATGTYTPGTEQTDSFTIPSNVIVLGGFNGTETTTDERNWAENPTILSGDLNNSQTANEGDSHTIVTMLGDNAEINGFFIQWSFADDGTDHSQPDIGRSGAGVYNNGDNRIYNCTLRSNVADTTDDPEIGTGAGLVSFGGTLDIINCLFNSNTASANGGAMSAESGTINIINCTIANNNANKGGGVHFYNGNINTTNTIFTNNNGTNGNINDDGGAGTGTANYCLFYNATTGNDGNLPPNITGNNNIENTDPIYTNGYQIVYSSLATDAGDNTANPLSLDLNAQNRISNTTIDIGAYEFQNNLQPDANNIIYVNKNVSGGNEIGNSWTNAVPELADALLWASSLQDTAWETTPLQIWVAGGTYNPKYSPEDGVNFGTDQGRENAFLMVANVQLYGGFAGNETSLADRDLSITTNTTVLSGDINGNDALISPAPIAGNPYTSTSIADNTYHVVMGAGNVGEGIIDGFTITGGNTISNHDPYYINGYYFIRSAGGGIYLRGSNLKLKNIIVYGNNADTYGAGIMLLESTPSLLNVNINRNTCNSQGGGLFINLNSFPNLTNVSITNNTATTGSGVYTRNSSPSFNNCIIWGEIYNDNSSPTYTNSLIEGNTDTSNGNINATGLTETDIFTDPTNGDFSLISDSPAVNAGNNTAYTNAGGDLINDTDLAGNPRIFDTTIDVGAYEAQGLCSDLGGSDIAYVDNTATGNNNGTSWANAFTDLETALSLQDCGFTGEIRVAGGQTFKPSASRLCTSGCTSPRDYYFLIHEDIQLKGSYDVSTNTQDYSNPTTLSGDIGNTGDTSDNTSHVVVTTNLTNAASLDGFIITNGNANLNVYPTINTIQIESYRGGGMHNNNNSSPTITNTTFFNNFASSLGGGMYNNSSSSPNITNVSFVNNSSSSFGGGMYNNFSSSPSITNVSFVNNSATNGGGMHNNNNSSPTITNSTFVNNSASNSNGGGIYNSSSNASLFNTVLYANGNDIYINGSSSLDGSSANNFSETSYLLGNQGVSFTQITDDPFVDSSNPIGADGIWNTADDGLYPANGSVLINAGDNSFNTEATDITGNLRVFDGTIDVGAYEQNPCLNVGSIIYVDQDATSGANDGSSWANAFTSLETALSLQDCGFTGEIRVAGGQTFKPSASRLCSDCSDDRSYYFLIHEDIQLKGSFIVGTDTQDHSNSTILSGDIGTLNDNSDNIYHVVITINLTNAATIDGFTITNGHANYTNFTVNGIIFSGNGGGMYNNYSSPSIINSTFSNNSSPRGGGMFNRYSYPSISNSTFSNNSATSSFGGGMYNNYSSPSITNSTFSNNSSVYYGGAMYNRYSDPSISNSTFSNNYAIYFGGGMHNNYSSPSITNSTFSNNYANVGSGIYNDGTSNPVLYNTVLYNNTGNDISNHTNSSINNNSSNNFSETSYLLGNQGVSFTQLSTDPFVDSSNPIGADGVWNTADDGLYPANGSVLINAGDNSFNTESTDITGNPRIFDTTIDVGAYELQSTLSNNSANKTNNEFVVYPNPTTHMLYIQTNLKQFSYELYNIQGQKIMASKQAVNTINTSQLATGVYVLKLNSGNKTQSIKVIKK